MEPTTTRLAGDLQVDGRDIRVAGGITNIAMNTDINTTFAGDITVGVMKLETVMVY